MSISYPKYVTIYNMYLLKSFPRKYSVIFIFVFINLSHLTKSQDGSFRAQKPLSEMGSQAPGVMFSNPGKVFDKHISVRNSKSTGEKITKESVTQVLSIGSEVGSSSSPIHIEVVKGPNFGAKFQARMGLAELTGNDGKFAYSDIELVPVYSHAKRQAQHFVAENYERTQNVNFEAKKVDVTNVIDPSVISSSNGSSYTDQINKWIRNKNYTNFIFGTPTNSKSDREQPTDLYNIHKRITPTKSKVNLQPQSRAASWIPSTTNRNSGFPKEIQRKNSFNSALLKPNIGNDKFDIYGKIPHIVYDEDGRRQDFFHPIGIVLNDTLIKPNNNIPNSYNINIPNLPEFGDSKIMDGFQVNTYKNPTSLKSVLSLSKNRLVNPFSETVNKNPAYSQTLSSQNVNIKVLSTFANKIISENSNNSTDDGEMQNETFWNFTNATLDQNSNNDHFYMDESIMDNNNTYQEHPEYHIPNQSDFKLDVFESAESIRNFVNLPSPIHDYSGGSPYDPYPGFDPYTPTTSKDYNVYSFGDVTQSPTYNIMKQFSQQRHHPNILHGHSHLTIPDVYYQSPVAPCATKEFPDQVVVNPSADVFIGIIVPLSRNLESGHKCKGLEPSFVDSLEAIKFILRRINKSMGQVGQRIVTNSYVPGLTFGLKILNTCSDADLYRQSFESLYPQLVHPECTFDSLDQIAVVDMQHDKHREGFAEKISALGIPVIPANPTRIVETTERAKILLNVLVSLKLQRVVMLYSGDDYSLAVTNELVSLSVNSDVCVTTTIALPSTGNSTAFTDILLMTSRTVTNENPQGILFLINDDDIEKVLSSLTSVTFSPSLHVVLSDVPVGVDGLSALRSFVRTVPFSVWTVSAFPPMNEFEGWLAEMNVAKMEVSHSNAWLAQSFQEKNSCVLPDWVNMTTFDHVDMTRSTPFNTLPYCIGTRHRDIDDLSLLSRTKALTASSHAVITAINAVKKIWALRCRNRPGICDNLRKTSLQDFTNSVLIPFEFSHKGPGSRSPLSLAGKKLSNDQQAHLTGSTLGVHKLGTRNARDISVTLVLEVSNATVIIRNKFALPSFPNTPCTEEHCKHCLHKLSKDLRNNGSSESNDSMSMSSSVVNELHIDHTTQSVVKDDPTDNKGVQDNLVEFDIIRLNNSDFDIYELANEKVEASDEIFQYEDTEHKVVQLTESSSFGTIYPYIFKESPQDVYIAGFFPVHLPSADGSGCSAAINSKAVEEVEAFLWAIDQINLHPHLLPNTTLGVLVMDTCESLIRTTNQLTSLVEGTLPGLEIPLEKILCFVTSLSPHHAKVVGDMFSSLNISSINLGFSLSYSPYSLQMTSSPNVQAETLVQILKFIGWEFVSVVVSENNPYSAMVTSAFRTMTSVSGICIGLELTMRTYRDEQKELEHVTEVVSRLSSLSVKGARGVMLFLSDRDMDRLLHGIQLAEGSGTIEAMSLVPFVITRSHVSLPSWAPIGSVMLKTDLGVVNDFMDYYRGLESEKNPRNHWFREMKSQESLYRDSTLPSAPHNFTPLSPTRVIQSVFTFGAALSQLLQHLCPLSNGFLCPSLHGWSRRSAMSEFLRSTEVSRVDKPHEFFRFSENFHGNIPINVWNRQRETTESDFLNSTTLVKLGRYFNSVLSITKPMGENSDGNQRKLSSMVSSCRETCTAHCNNQESDYLFVESPDQLYVVAILDIHHRGETPLDCGPIRGIESIQELEAFLLSLSQANAPQTSGNVPPLNIGAIVIDSCSSKEKVLRDLGNLLTGKLPTNIASKLHSPTHIIGVIIGGDSDITQTVLDVTQSYGIITLATVTPSNKLVTRYTQTLWLRPSYAQQVQAMTTLLRHYDWRYVSVVYSNGTEEGDRPYNFLSQNRTEDLTLAVVEAVPLEIPSPEYLLDIWSRLLQGARKGARVVMLWLTPLHLRLLMESGDTLVRERKMKRSDLVLVLIAPTQETVEYLSSEFISLVVGKQYSPVEGFKEHISGLSLSNRSSLYPWYADIWSELLGCRGKSCLPMKSQTLGQVFPSIAVSTSIPLIGEAVSLITSAAVDTLTLLCNGHMDVTRCSLLTDANYRQTLFEKTKQGFETHKLEVSTYGSFGKDITSARVKLGYFSPGGVLIFNSTLNGTGMNFKNVISKCLDPIFCNGEFIDEQKMSTKIETKADSLQQAEMILPSKHYTMMATMPIHENGDSFFSCGKFKDETTFHNLAAMAYALKEINERANISGLGAIVFDYCDRKEKATEQVYNYFSGKLKSNQTVFPTENIVAAISFHDAISETVSTIYSANSVPHFTSSVAGIKLNNRGDDRTISSVPSKNSEIIVYKDILRLFDWNYVTLIHDNDETSRYLAENFTFMVQKEKICVGDTVRINETLSEEQAVDIIESLAQNWKPRVIILLMYDIVKIKTLLETVIQKGESEKFVFIIGTALGKREIILGQNPGLNIYSLTLETYDFPNFRSFLSNLTLENHYPIPSSWFFEYYQDTFKCRIFVGDEADVDNFDQNCDGSEIINTDPIKVNPSVFQTILTIFSIADSLTYVTNKQCPDAVDCDIDPSQLLSEISDYFTLSVNDSKDELLTKEKFSRYQLWNHLGGISGNGYLNIGEWKNGQLQIHRDSIQLEDITSICSSGQCLDVCSSQSSHYTDLLLPERLPMDHVFKSVYGILASVLTILGTLVVIITFIYFIVSFPTSAGTSVLGYMILSGCLLVYSSNFSFILQPSECTCAVRRFLAGVGYAVIYSAKLVKVLHSCRIAAYSEEQDYTSVIKPVVLFTLAVFLSLVQVIIAITWLILFPPDVILQEDTWRCSPGHHFELDLIVSLVYVMILIATTIFFSFSSWRSEDNSIESKWILLSSTLTACVFVAWTIVTILSPYRFKDPAVVVANLSSSTITLFFLYARKLYLTRQLSKEVRDLELRSQFTAASSIYNASLATHKIEDPLSLEPKSLHQFYPEAETAEEDYARRQFVGDQEVSFRTVALPPKGLSSTQNGIDRVRLDMNLNLNHPMDFESLSEEDFTMHDGDDSNKIVSEEESLYCLERNRGDESVEVTGGMSEGTFSRQGQEDESPVRRFGNRQRLVYLMDGSTMGEVSRI